MDNVKAAANLTAEQLDQLAINTIRFLSVDAVQRADSGHPGMPLGAAPMAYVLWHCFLRHSPTNPHWFNRDRFILSAGHGSMLLYSLLYLTGYDLPLEQIMKFRSLNSMAPGHPERGITPGVEITTGPLGQGFAAGVGMAITEAHLASCYNQPDAQIINHYTYGIVSDGDLMEGISSEAASLAGHLKLGKLIYLYDQNHISLAGATQLTFTEDCAERFNALGWHTKSLDDGNDINAIEQAIGAAQAETDRPSLILIRTHIGYGSPSKQDTFAAHGSPLGEEEVKATKRNLGWPIEPSFYVPAEVLTHLRSAVQLGKAAEAQWQTIFDAFCAKYPEAAHCLSKRLAGCLPAKWSATLPTFSADQSGLSTRKASGKVLQALMPELPALMGGSADLNPSTYSILPGAGDFSPPQQATGDLQGAVGGGFSYRGRNVHFGVREHAMGAILNGMAAHGGVIPFGSTFLTFSDYMRPSLRLAALMRLKVIYLFTHDSLALGEDGPTHQSVEHLASLRAIPELIVIRPGDANETTEAWRVAISMQERPVALVLSRQNVPTLDRKYFAGADGLSRGAYILAAEAGDKPPQLILIGSGSEVGLVVAAGRKLLEQKIAVRLVSMPSWELFELQTREYRDYVLPPSVKARLAVEAGVTQGWHRYVGDHGDVIGVDRFGTSAPGPIVMSTYGFTADHVYERALAILKWQEYSPKLDFTPPISPTKIGIAADHGGFELKQHLVKMLTEASYEVVDFGDHQLIPDDDYPDFVIPMATALSAHHIDRGIAVCGSGVGACVVANKIQGVRAALIGDTFSAHQGVEDDDLNLLCLGGSVVAAASAWELVRTFLAARFSTAERHRRRVAKINALDQTHSPTVG